MSHIVVKKGGSYILKEGLDSGRDAYLRGGHILGVRGRFWESGIYFF